MKYLNRNKVREFLIGIGSVTEYNDQFFDINGNCVAWIGFDDPCEGNVTAEERHSAIAKFEVRYVSAVGQNDVSKLKVIIPGMNPRFIPGIESYRRKAMKF